MSTLDNLQLLLLSVLHGKRRPISRYEAMTTLNQVTTQMDRPYSPGAVYHCIKGLTSSDMINFNQKFIEITPLGFSALEGRLVNAPLSDSILAITYDALAIQLANDAKLKEKGIQRLKIELIKFNQFHSSSIAPDPEMRRVEMALKSCRYEVITALSKFVIELGALK